MVQPNRVTVPKSVEDKRDDLGFTLIELLIVIVVMGILAAVAIFALGGVTGKSQVTACNTDAKTVQLALSAYETQNPTVTSSVSIATLVSGGFLLSTPSSGNGYSIGVTGNPPNEQVTVGIGTGSPVAYTGGTSGSGSCSGA